MALQASPDSGKVLLIGCQRMEVSRESPPDRTMTWVIGRPMRAIAGALIDGMVKAAIGQGGNPTSTMPFEIITRKDL